MSKSRKQRFLAPSPRQGHTRTLQPLSSPPRLLCRSPGPDPSVSGLRCPKPHLSRVFKLTPARNTLHTALARTLRAHRHRRHALPLHTRSSTTPPKHSPAQNGQGPPLGDPGRPWLATALGSSAAVSGSPHDSTPTASFDARLVDLLRPRPMRSCSLVQASTQMPTSLVVAAYERRCVRSTLERERRAAGHQCAAREPPGPESGRGTTEHAQESTLADSRPQSGRQERAGDGRSKRPPSRAQGKNLCRTGLWRPWRWTRRLARYNCTSGT